MPPLHIHVPEAAGGLGDHITYPKKESEMSPRELRNVARRAQKLKVRAEKRAQRGADQDRDEDDDLVAG